MPDDRMEEIRAALHRARRGDRNPDGTYSLWPESLLKLTFEILAEVERLQKWQSAARADIPFLLGEVERLKAGAKMQEAENIRVHDGWSRSIDKRNQMAEHMTELQAENARLREQLVEAEGCINFGLYPCGMFNDGCQCQGCNTERYQIKYTEGYTR